MRVFARHRSEHAERRRDRVAAAFDRELHDVLGIEEHRVRRKRRARRVLDALIDRKNRHIAGTRQPPVIEQRLQGRQHARRPIGNAVNALDVVGPGEMQRLLRDGLALVLKQAGRFVSKNFFDLRTDTLNCHDYVLPLRNGYFSTRIVEVLCDGRFDGLTHKIVDRQRPSARAMSFGRAFVAGCFGVNSWQQS